MIIMIITMIMTRMGDSMEGLSEMGERRSRVASTSSLAQVAIIIVMKMINDHHCDEDDE